jgi:hypothetical protein
VATTSSRYAGAPIYQARLPDGRTAAALVIPGPRSPAPLGYHPRALGDRLDLLAATYLDDPTGFWRLCDANNAIVAGTLEAHDLIGIPAIGS